MDDFSVKPGVPNMYGLIGSEANSIAPGKRMLSSMTPTIVLRDGAVRLVVGSPGGSTIPTTVLQVVLNVLAHGMPLQSAVAAPRFHHQWLPDRTRPRHPHRGRHGPAHRRQRPPPRRRGRRVLNPSK